MKRILLMLMIAALVAASQAAVVSWNYDNNSTVGGDGAGSLPPADATAGVVDAGNWINTWPDNQTTDLRDDSGASTTIDIAWENPASYSIGGHPGQDADGTWNKEMINGYMNAGVAEWTPIAQSTVTLSEIPYDGYDIVVYFSCDVAGRTGTITDGTTTYYFNTMGPASLDDGFGNANLVQTTATTTAGYSVAANYAVFSGLTGDSQTVTCDIPDWGGIAAVQVTVVDYVTATDPGNGEINVAIDLSDRTDPNYLSWFAPNDPNIATITGYDIYVDPNQAKVDSRDSECEIVATGLGVAKYDPASNFDFLKTYYWVVDTHYTRDDGPGAYVGEPNAWSFKTVSAAPVIETYDNVVLDATLLPAELSAVVTDADNNLSSASFELLTDDGDFPAGATAYLQNENYSNKYAPSCELMADTPGWYKIKLTVSDGTNTADDIAEVHLYAGDDPNRCAAAENSPNTWPGWNPMDFNYDCFVNLTDFVEVALQWLDDRTLDDQGTYPFDPDYPQYGPVVNGIVDGNFEAGDGWFVGYYNQWWWWNDGVEFTDVDPIGPSWSIQWTTAAWATGGGMGVITYQTVKADTSYQFKVDILSDAAETDTTIHVGYAGDGWPADFASAVAGTDWTADGTAITVTVPFTTGAGDEGAKVQFAIYSSIEGTYRKLDNYQLIELP